MSGNKKKKLVILILALIAAFVWGVVLYGFYDSRNGQGSVVAKSYKSNSDVSKAETSDAVSAEEATVSDLRNEAET